MAVNDNMIELIAKLDEDKSVKQIVETDIPIIRDRINESKALQIKCTIDKDSINDIKNQLKDIKINVGASIQPTTIHSNPVTESEVKINATSVKEQIAELKQTLNANLSGNTKEVMDGLTSQIKEGSTVWTNWLRGANDKVKSFSISVREATGELTKYNYAINEYGNAKFLGSSGTDKGIEKVQKEIDSFVKQLSAMKRNVGSFTGIYADIGEGADKTRITFDTLGKSIEDLKNGKKSIADVRGEIVALQGAVDSVNSILGHAQGKGFNKFENAETDARNFDNTIKKIETDLNGLNKADGNVKELSKRLKAVRTEALDLANVSEKTQEWAYSYDKVSIELMDIQSEIKIIKQLEKQDKSSAAQRTIADLQALEQAYKAVEKYTKVLKSSSASKEEKATASAYVLNYNNRIKAIQESLKSEKLLTKEVRARIKEIKAEHTEVINNINAKAKGTASREAENKSNQRREELLKKIESANKDINQLEQKSINAGETKTKVYAKEIESLQKTVQLSKEKLDNEGLLNKSAKERIADSEKELELQRSFRAADEVDKSNTQREQALKKETEELEKQLKLWQQLNNSIYGKINSLGSQSNNAVFRSNATNSDVQEQVAKINELQARYKELLVTLQEAKTPEALLEIKKKLNELTKDFNKTTSEAKELQRTLSSDSAFESKNNRIQALAANMEKFASANKKAVQSTKQMSSGMTFADKWNELMSKMAKGADLSADELKHLNEEVNTFKKEADAAGLTVSSLFRNMRTQLGQVLMQWISLQGAVRVIRSMVDEVRGLDAAMVNLKKVTDETDETYRKFISSSQKQAAQLHATTTDVVEQSAEWAKLGFNLEEAQELSKTSMIYSKVGEVDNATAVSDLITVLKAFNQTADESIKTVDALNKLGNTFATDAKSLGEGLSVSASTLAMSGNDLNQTLALLTGATEITQNARETGNALKILALRVRGMKGALEELNEETEGLESVSKIQTQILNLTNNRVNIFNDDGSFKSTYEILKQISEIYDSLSDPNKASLSEIVFGKVRANQGYAIIQAFQSGQIEKAYEAAVNSAGSAQEEFDRLSEGIEAHIQDFKQAFETLSNTVINSDLIKFVVDSGTTILKILNAITDKIGTLPTLLTGLAAVGSFKGIGRPYKPNMPKPVLLQINECTE